VQDAYVENLDGPQLFEAMYMDDPDGKTLGRMPGVDELLIPYPFSHNTANINCRVILGYFKLTFY